MGTLLTNESSLTSIANAIRTKGGTSENLVYPDGFISAIGALSSGSGEWEDVSDDFLYVSMYAKYPWESYPITAISNGTVIFLYAVNPGEDMVVVVPAGGGLAPSGNSYAILYQCETGDMAQVEFIQSLSGAFGNLDFYTHTDSDMGWGDYYNSPHIIYAVMGVNNQ